LREVGRERAGETQKNSQRGRGRGGANRQESKKIGGFIRGSLLNLLYVKEILSGGPLVAANLRGGSAKGMKNTVNGMELYLRGGICWEKSLTSRFFLGKVEKGLFRTKDTVVGGSFPSDTYGKRRRLVEGYRRKESLHS